MIFAVLDAKFYFCTLASSWRGLRVLKLIINNIPAPSLYTQSPKTVRILGVWLF